MRSLIVQTNNKFKLSHHVWQRRFFDANNKDDLQDYSYFLKNSKWPTNCPFILEWPYLTVTDMIKDKIVENYIEMLVDFAEANEE